MSLSFDEFLKKAGGKAEDVKISSEPIEPLAQQAGLLSRVASDISKRGEAVVGEITKEQNPLLAGLKATAQIFGGISDVATEVSRTIAPTITKKAEEVIQKGFSKIVDYSTPIGQKLLELEKSHPEIARSIENFLEGASASGEIAGNILLAEGTKVGLQKTADLTKQAISKLPIEKTGELLKQAGEKTTGIAITSKEPLLIALQSYEAQQPTLFQRVKNFIGGEKAEVIGTKPITEAQTATRLGVAGTEWQLGVKSVRIKNQLWDDIIEPALEASGEFVSKNEFLNSLRQRIISENADLSRRGTLLNALESFSEDFKHVNQFKLPKLQAYKEGWAKFVPEKAYKGQPIAGALNEVRNLAAQEARKIIYEKLGDKVKAAYLDYSNLISIAEGAIKSVEALGAKSWSRKLWEAFIDKTVTPVSTYGGQVLYRTGDKLEFLGKKGAKKIGDIIK